MRAFLQHRFNVLHVYCRLSGILGPRLARSIATVWERTAAYRILYA
ncbi:MAG TPA: hypothetical protein PLM79_00855 [Syntrophobacteraceae bacterium]|nr:hypothetical protein [Syntrophobacteraceae bacterium]